MTVHAFTRIWPRALLVAVAAGGLLLAGCAPSRIHRLTKEVYSPKAEFARVDVYAGPLTRPCQPIAWIQSRRYELPDYAPKSKVPAEKARHEAARSDQETIKQQMVVDLEELTRQLGGDAVDRVHMGEERSHGWLPDTDVPVPGAVRQGYRYRYFYIGEVVKYLDASPGETASPDEAASPVPAVPDISVEVLPLDEFTLPPAPANRSQAGRLTYFEEGVSHHEQDPPHRRHARRRHRPRSRRRGRQGP